MPKFSRDDLITTLKMMLDSVQDITDMEVRRTMALSMFEVTLVNRHFLTQQNDQKLIQVCYDKAREREGDPRFTTYVHKFEELIKKPPLRRSARLAKRV